MSDSTHEPAHEDTIPGPIKTPTQLFWISLAGFAVPILAIIGLASWIDSRPLMSPGETNAAEKVAARIQKVGTVEIRDADRPLASGEDVYNAQCMACHATGVADAPKLGDAGDWAPRIKLGYEALLGSALNGKGAMAPQGGGNYSDVEIGRAVVYMANAAGAKFDDPAGAEATASAAAPAPAEPAPAAPAAEESAAAAPAAEAPAAAEAAPAAASGSIDVAAGKALYDKSCLACHGTGVAGAPKLGDKAAWGPRIAEGMDAMMHIAINGKGAMPPRGATTATDDELRAAVEYMVQAAQ